MDPLGNSAPGPLSNHRLPHELPEHHSHQWASPGKVGTKFMATPGMEGGQPSISGVFAGALGLHRWRWLILRISKEKNREQSVRSPQRS